MFGLAYVLIPRKFKSLQVELDRTLAPFKRGGEADFPRGKLAFDDATDRLARLHRVHFRYDPDRSLSLREHDISYDLRLQKLAEHLAACRLDRFEGTFAEIEPDFDAFVRRFTDYADRDTTTGRYGRWLNPIGNWDWWDLGGRFNGAITGERRPAGHDQAISSGPSSGRAIMENLAGALGVDRKCEAAEIEENVELFETLKARKPGRPRGLPTAVVLPAGCCADEDRWFDRVEWHEIKSGMRDVLDVSAHADFDALVGATYERFSNHAAAGVAYHF